MSYVYDGFETETYTQVNKKTLERCKLKTLSSPCIDKRLFMQSVALSLLRFTFFQSERLHKNTTTFKEVYTEIEDIQGIDTHFILFFVGKKCSRSIKAFLRFRLKGKFVSRNRVSHDLIFLYTRY